MLSVEIEYEPIIDILEDILGQSRKHNEYSGQISFDCPVCSYDIKGLDEGDGKGNLEVNYKIEAYKCWSCGETHETHGSLYKLIKKYGSSKHLKKFLLLRPEHDENGIKKKVYKKVQLPKEFIPFKSASMGMKLTPHYKQAYNYLKFTRKVTDDIIEKYNIGFCYQGKYANRIIVPSYDENGDVNYFVGRSYLTRTKKKYDNPEAAKELIIWNEHLINWDEPIYLVEGVFDGIFLPNSIPMLGKFISDLLYQKLYEKAKKIIIILDGDAWEDAVKLYHKINCGRLLGKVWIVQLPEDKDIGDLRGDLSDFKIKQID